MAGILPGQHYRFATGDLVFADPASRAQADDTDGWSVLVAPMPAGSARSRRPWHEVILAEIHVGTATPEGTFEALAERLPHFADAGYTAIELMPIGDFPGSGNWGYDGVLPFAPEASYGSPGTLRALVERAHALGLAVLLDVVYNHFGPIDNLLPHYAAPFFDGGEPTPWGPAINLAHPLVRRFFIENVAMWLGEYDFDGLRFDAVHEFRTDGAAAFKCEIAEAARAIKPDALLVLEDLHYEAGLVKRDEGGGVPLFNAIWNDDIHHSLHVLATEQNGGYYRAFAEEPMLRARQALSDGVPGRSGETAGQDDVAHFPPEAFVSFIQNHDQIGNQPDGRRLAEELDAERLDFLHFVIMLSPQIPMFFMGEEAHMRSVFPFFGDLKGHLSDAIREGRARQAAEFYDHRPDDTPLPDPVAEETVAMAKLDWDEFGLPERREAMARFKELVALRRAHVWPVTASRYHGSETVESAMSLAIRWRYDDRTLVLAMNPSPHPGALDLVAGAPFATTGQVDPVEHGLEFGPWSAAIWIEPADGVAENKDSETIAAAAP
ncbi:alpha-amylase family glycosyl hydrolase [Kaistia dalseonensis]|uniref:Malto-oligosyltrehalose trehalohydrolase n=1 Tax=Kaistia dalseonensis TaxID=410840 RepID=A0ABU0H4W3_9HYPH|nr:alpha-amylase family glycosyl hydrolase [Kaistia dalseonensis]MCX5494768.1 alpha-amylase family glycosyl hydrolase [Kaistia dalseonensis]MDQ0437349.1 malto-oligosyltrehalose trehalohydrolase [Kaistia dalseonensis]